MPGYRLGMFQRNLFGLGIGWLAGWLTGLKVLINVVVLKDTSLEKSIKEENMNM